MWMQQYRMCLQQLHSDLVTVQYDQKSLGWMSFTKEWFTSGVWLRSKLRNFAFRCESKEESSLHRNLDLHEAFFSPWRAIAEGGFDPIIRGILFGQAKKSDPNSVMSEELRDKLFKLGWYSLKVDFSVIVHFQQTKVDLIWQVWIYNEGEIMAFRFMAIGKLKLSYYVAKMVNSPISATG